VVTEANSKATVIESYVSMADHAYLTDAVTEIVAGEGANVDHYKFLRESPDAYHVSIGRLELKRDSNVTSTVIGQGAAIARNDMHANQAEMGSTSRQWGLYVMRGSEHLDHYINVDHAAPHATSRIYYKGILDGEAHAIYGGTVFVHRGAQKIDARQDDKNLLLSEGAEVDTKPALEIYADDIKAGHGAASGKIDENTLFYMRSRGLDLETASQLLIYGFASEVIESVQLAGFRQYLTGWFDSIAGKLSHVRFGEGT
jgi:Fe-S cluster assembly protein SufD